MLHPRHTEPAPANAKLMKNEEASHTFPVVYWQCIAFSRSFSLFQFSSLHSLHFLALSMAALTPWRSPTRTIDRLNLKCFVFRWHHCWCKSLTHSQRTSYGSLLELSSNGSNGWMRFSGISFINVCLRTHRSWILRSTIRNVLLIYRRRQICAIFSQFSCCGKYPKSINSPNEMKRKTALRIWLCDAVMRSRWKIIGWRRSKRTAVREAFNFYCDIVS